MSMLGGLFGIGHRHHPNFDRIAHALHSHLGLNTTVPTTDVLAILERMSARELLNFDNMQSVPGMQALFTAKAIVASVDTATSTVTLSLASAEGTANGTPATSASPPAIRIREHRAEVHVAKPQDAGILAMTAVSTVGRPATESSAPMPAAFEHLEAFEQLAPKIVDLLLRHGQLTSADKDVLKRIRPLDSSLDARLIALERWKTEITRRVRGVTVPKSAQRMNLSGDVRLAAGSEEALMRRLDALLAWTSKLIKAVEHEGIKFHNKPMWLPH